MSTEKHIVIIDIQNTNGFTGYYQKQNQPFENSVWYFDCDIAVHIAGSQSHYKYTQLPLADVYIKNNDWRKLNVTHIKLMEWDYL